MSRIIFWLPKSLGRPSMRSQPAPRHKLTLTYAHAITLAAQKVVSSRTVSWPAYYSGTALITPASSQQAPA
jgi:hypothetical protein